MSGASDKELSKPPVSKLFQERFMLCNNLGMIGFQEWVFLPAMLFNSPDKWWGDFGKRDRPHEGLDLCTYRTEKGNIHHLDGKTGVPLIFEGRVIKVDRDFLGESIFISHDYFDGNSRRLYTIYGHIKPSRSLRTGERLREGDIIGTIAVARKSHNTIHPHLHISVAWIPNTISSQELDWRLVGDPVRVALFDPLNVIECPYSIVTAI